MPAVSTLLIAGLALGAIGTGTQVIAASNSAASQRRILAENKRQETIRENAMRAEAHRKQLEVLRQSQKVRAAGLSAAENQGADEGSGLQGAFGQVSGQTGSNFTGLTQSTAFGAAIFDSNRAIAGYKQDAADSSTLNAFGQGFGQIGSALTSTASVYGRLGANPYNPNYNYTYMTDPYKNFTGVGSQPY